MNPPRHEGMFHFAAEYGLSGNGSVIRVLKGGIRVNVTLHQQTVRMARLVGTTTQQSVTEASLDLPSALPDIARVVRVAARPVVTDWEATDNEVVVQGTVDFVLIYAHEREVPIETHDIEAERGYDEDDDHGPSSFDDVEYREVLYRHRWRRGGSFEVVLDVPGAHPDVVVDVGARPDDIDVQLHQSGRGLDVEAVVSVSARVSEHDDVVVSVQGDAFPADVDADVEEAQVEHAGGFGHTQLSVQGVLSVSTDIPLERVVDITAWARATAEAAADDQVTATGTVDYKLLCVDENGELVTVEWQAQTPFSYTFDIPGVAAGASVGAEVRVTGVDAVTGEGGRAIEVYTDLDVRADATEVQTLRLLVGVSGPEGTEIRYRTTTFSLEQTVGEGSSEERLRQSLELPQGNPPVDRLLFSEARAAVEDVLVLGDKVIAEGFVDIGALYVARAEGQPVYFVSWQKAVTMESEIAVPGAEPGMDAQVTADVTSIELDLLNRETVEVDVRLAAEAKVSRSVERDAIIEAVAVPPVDPDPPTLTFVVVQPGDTLWKLSHRYHTDVEQIVRANPWLEGAHTASLPVGRKLCVPRRKPSSAVV